MDILVYLERNYKYLSNDIKDLDRELYVSPHSTIIKARTIAEKILQEVSKLEGYGLLSMMTQLGKLKKLEDEGVLEDNISDLFHKVRKIGNEAAHSNIEGELEAALNIHKNIYKIISWFIESYVDYKFVAPQYKSPLPIDNKLLNISKDIIIDLVKTILNEQLIDKNIGQTLKSSAKDEKKFLTEFDNLNHEPSVKCLANELSKLRESSKEAVEGLGEFTDFKRYMHIERDAQKMLEEIIIKANESEKAQLILVSGSVGDGKSHLISYFKNRYPDIMNNFILHNDATESLEPNKTSVETLNEVLDEFCDEKIKEHDAKLIIAINLGTLNNFIDSKYGERFSILKKYVRDKKIVETSIEYNVFDENNLFQFINFSDYHIFTLKDGKVCSKYIESLINKVVDSSELNPFYNSYKKDCIKCESFNYCPIKSNFELLSNKIVQEIIIGLLVKCIIKDKIIISTRALINFIYELIVPISYIDINSPTFKSDILKFTNSTYIKSLLPNIIFNHRELSFIFESLSGLDPLDIRNPKVDNFIIEFTNSTDFLYYFKEYIDFPEGYINKISKISFEETKDEKIRDELLKLFIRSYYMIGIGDLFALQDIVYEDYMKNIYFWNKGDKHKLKNLYNIVKSGILKWNGESEKDQINIFMGKNQIKFKISQNIELKPNTSNLLENEANELKKFNTTLKLQYKNENKDKSYEIDIDFSLYKLLIKITNGYRPNKKDKNQFINFIQFINKLEETGSQNDKLIFIEKNKNINRKYKLEYDCEFEFYKFMEIEI